MSWVQPDIRNFKVLRNASSNNCKRKVTHHKQCYGHYSFVYLSGDNLINRIHPGHETKLGIRAVRQRDIRLLWSATEPTAYKHVAMRRITMSKQSVEIGVIVDLLLCERRRGN